MTTPSSVAKPRPASHISLKIACLGPVARIEGPEISINLVTPPPSLEPSGSGSRGAWEEDLERDIFSLILGGIPGQAAIAVFHVDGAVFELTRWTGADGSVAIRVGIDNRGAIPIHPGRLTAFVTEGGDAIQVGGANLDGCEILAQARQKNGIPARLRLDPADPDYRQFAAGCAEVGDPAAPPDQAVAIKADPFIVLRSPNDEHGPHLLIGWISESDHISQLVMTPTANAGWCLSGENDFDRCLVSPGERRDGQWLVFHAGRDPQLLIEAYTERVAVMCSAPRPATQPPSVWCSWYHWGPHFHEADLHGLLGWLDENRLPFDVLLIDDVSARHWGDWWRREHWPSGLKDAADRIRGLGYTPGMWTAPFLARPATVTASEHPDWLLRDRRGRPLRFQMDGYSYILDPTHPEVDSHLESLFRSLTHEAGFTYHKMDFMRAVFMDRDARFFDPKATRLQAYRRGLAAIRRGAGPGAYLAVCGGHYGASIGLANAQRSGSDVIADWNNPPALPKIRQSLMRTWMNRLWHTDADAMMVRRNDMPRNTTKHARLGLGQFNDDEARTIATNQYVAGGMVCFTEPFPIIEPDRASLYPRVVPASGSPGIPLDPFTRDCPSVMLNIVTPRCEALEPWVTVTVFNWSDTPARRAITLTPAITSRVPAERYLLFELWEQRLLDVAAAGDEVDLGEIPAHGCRVVRIAAWRNDHPTLAGTDLHLTGGGIELTTWHTEPGRAAGRVQSRWPVPIRISVAFPDREQVRILSQVVTPDAAGFDLRWKR